LNNYCESLDFWQTKGDNAIMADESEVEDLPKKKIGRPTSNPKNDRITVRLDKKSESVLSLYCKQESVDRAEAVRRGVCKLESDLRK